MWGIPEAPLRGAGRGPGEAVRGSGEAVRGSGEAVRGSGEEAPEGAIRAPDAAASASGETGRALCRRFGQALPKELMLRGYASPAERCLETAKLILEAHRQDGGGVTRHRPVEALGVFYVLDQMKMWRGMEQAGGGTAYLRKWFDGQVPADVMMPPELAARLLLRVMVEKGALNQGARAGAPRMELVAVGQPQLDLCVSHDMTLYLLRDQLLGEPVDGPAVEFLDGLIAWRDQETLWLKSLQGQPRQVSADLDEQGNTQ